MALPCPECSNHALLYLNSTPLYLPHTTDLLQIKTALAHYLYTFHNAVNLRLHKPLFAYSLAYPPVDLNKVARLYTNRVNVQYYSMLPAVYKNYVDNMILGFRQL